jgi:hypothetical protein
VAISTVHSNGAIVFAGSGAFNLDGVENLTLDPGLKEFMENGAGQVSPSFAGASQVEALISATINDIATAITGGIDIDGLSIPSSTVVTTCTVYHTKLVNAGTRAGTLLHFKTLINQGCVVPKSLKCDVGGHATMDIDIHATYDGTNNPLVFTDSVTLPHTPSIDELFVCGPVSINGTLVAGVQGITLDFGIEIEKLYDNGDVFPSYIAIKTVKPKITIKTLTIPSLSTFGIAGTAQGATASTIYFQKAAKGGSRTAAATAEHIKITVNSSQGFVYCGQATGGNNESAKGEIIIMPVVGSSAILTVSAASAIT